MIVCKKCGAVDKYTIERKSNNDVMRCSICNTSLGNKPYAQPMFYIGKYKNIPIVEIGDLSYLRWAINTLKLSESIRTAIQQRISQLEFISK